MAPPDMLDEAASASAPPLGPMLSDAAPADDLSVSDGGLRVELVHRHLVARLTVAKEQVRILEDHSTAPEALIARFGATITEAQRALAAERAEAEAAAESRRQAAEARAAELLSRAAREAKAMREVASHLRSGAARPLPTDGTPSVHGLETTLERSNR